MRTYSRKIFINIMLFIALIILGGTCVIAYIQTQRLLDANAWVIHTHEVIETADQAMLAITDAESRTSLFLISKDKQNIKDISVLIDKTYLLIEKMKLLTTDNTYQQDNINKLVPVIKSKFALMNKIIRGNDNNNKNIILSFSDSQKIASIKKQISEIISNLTNNELSLLEKRNDAFIQNAKQSNISLILVGIFSEILFILCVIVLNYQLYKNENIKRDLREGNKKLRTIQERFNLAVKGSNTGLWDWEVGSKEVYYSNNFRKLIGYSKSEFPNLFSSFEKVLHPDDRENVMALIQKHLDDGVTYKAEYRLKNKNGKYRWYRAVGEAKKDKHGRSRRMAGSLIDITERKKVEQMKNEFISIVSHELRTPLTSIHGAISLLTNPGVTQLSEEANQLLTIAKSNTERLIRLINDILDIEKIESGKMQFTLETYDLNKLVQEAISMNQPYANKFAVRIVLAKEIPTIMVKVDRDRLTQVFTNLLSNAIKFSPADEAVTIDISLKNKDIVRISISDKGEGIPEEFKAKIFQKFSQADSSSIRKHEGTGLGLNITKAIVEKLGGTIDFLTRKNHGTTFYFELPIVDTTTKTSKSKITNAAINILHLEDDDDLTRIVNSILTGHANIDNVKTIKQAKIELVYNKYDLAIVDLKLPDGSAGEILPILNQKNIPVIVFSAYELPPEQLGLVNCVLTKSKTSNEELLASIEKIIGSKIEKGDNYVDKTT